MGGSSKEDVIVDTNEVRFIEGHARLQVRMAGGDTVAEFQNLEGPRFLTKYLVGKPIGMAPMVASRICGLCYTAHSINAAEAIERALGIEVSKEVRELRTVLYLANNLRSHVMHLLYLTLPSIKGVISVLRLRDEDLYEAGTRLLTKSTELIEVWGGRSVHVPNVVVGGFGAVMNGRQLVSSVRELEGLMNDARKFADYAIELDLPELERYRPLGSLRNPGHYPTYAEDASMVLNDGSLLTSDEYYNSITEVTKYYSTSKHAYFRDSELTVGALSRVILNRRHLKPEAKAFAERVEWRMNPFLIIKAQAVEVVHYMEELIAAGQRLGDIIVEPSKEGAASGVNCSASQGETPDCQGTGRGFFVAEAPRGALCHACEVEKGKIKSYKVYTPTAVNSKSIELDAVEFVKKFRPLGVEKMRYVLEDMTRAYDPCLSCAVSLDIY